MKPGCSESVSDRRLIAVVLPSGNAAVYDVLPRHVPTPTEPQSYELPMMFGEQVAHELDGVWYQRGGWTPIEDQRAIANLEHLKEKLWQ